MASLARILRGKYVARSEPAKKHRASYRKFVYPAPHTCWQLDATEYVLTGGRKCVIFQMQDGRLYLAIAIHMVAGETARTAKLLEERLGAVSGGPELDRGQPPSRG